MTKSILAILMAGLSLGSCSKVCCPNKCETENRCTPPKTSNNTLNQSYMVNQNNSGEKLLHVCNLTSKEQRERMQKLGKTIFKDIQQINDKDNGVEMVFNQPVEYSEKLIEFINFERQCCPALTFQLEFKPDIGPIHLTIVAGKEVKQQILSGFKEYGHF